MTNSYWLRSGNSNTPWSVENNGNINRVSFEQRVVVRGIRPAMWINADYISKYEVVLPQKTGYYINEELDLSGMSVVSKTVDNMERQIESQNISIAGFDNKSTGKKTVYLIINGTNVCSFVVVINPLPLELFHGNIDIGDSIGFGSYHQDRGTSMIEWLVIDKDGDDYLVISRYAIDCYTYRAGSRIWSESDIRRTFMNDFYNEAFNSAEKQMIEYKKIYTGDSFSYDHVFLLSDEEIVKYFKSPEERMCLPTDFAIERGAIVDVNSTINGLSTTSWWSRSSVKSISSVKQRCVSANGKLGYIGNTEKHGVRPAMWITLD